MNKAQLKNLAEKAKQANPKGTGSAVFNPQWSDVNDILLARGFKRPEACAWLAKRGLRNFVYIEEAAKQ